MFSITAAILGIKMSSSEAMSGSLSGSVLTASLLSMGPSAHSSFGASAVNGVLGERGKNDDDDAVLAILPGDRDS